MAEERYTGDEEKDKATKKTAKLQRQQELNDVRHVVNSAPGRRFMARLISAANYNQNPHIPGSFDLTAHRCGQRSIAQFIINETMEASAEAYVELMVDIMKGN